MAHLSQGYMHAHDAYGSAVPNNPEKDAYIKAIKSIQKTLENPHEYYETFIIKEILKIGDAYQSLRNEINKWSQLKNRLKANAKNKELGVYVAVLQQTKMYETLSKLLSPTVGHTKSIQTAACKTLSVIVFRPNRYRDAEWYNKKQKIIALKQFDINGSIYTVLLLVSHILNIDNDSLIQYQNLNLICYTLQLLSNLVNHNSDVILAIHKNFKFISLIFKILNNDSFFELSSNNKHNNNTKNIKRNTINQIALLTLINGLNALLNMTQHNETNRKEFYQMKGWEIICKCLKHNCMEIRELSLCFINTLCVSSKLSAKYFLNTKFNGFESFQILLNMINKICIMINNENKNIIFDKTKYQRIDNLLCKLICSLSSLCNDNMIGYRKFCFYKSWKTIRKLLQTINKIKNYKFSKTLNSQIFSLLTCFNVPHSYEKWKELQWNIMFKNDNYNKIEFRKKLTMKEKKLAQKKDEKLAENEYKKTQRICKEIIRMLGGYVHSSESPSPEPNNKQNENENENENEEEDESYNRDIILKYLFESLSSIDYVIGSLCALGKLCKLKYNGNIIRLDQIIEIIKRDNINKYNLSLSGLKDKMSRSFTKCQFMSNNEFNQLIYLINALNDIFDGIINQNENKSNGKEIRELLIKTNTIYVLCRIITQPINKFFIQQHQYTSNNKIDHNKIQKINKMRYKKIKDLKLNACNALGKVIKYDIKMQMFFGQWIQNIYIALKDLAMDPVDNSLLQIGITHVIQSGCFKPINNQNIKQFRSFNVEHMLNQLYKQIHGTNTTH